MRVPRSSIAGEGRFLPCLMDMHGTRGKTSLRFEVFGFLLASLGWKKVCTFQETKGGERHVFLC